MRHRKSQWYILLSGSRLFVLLENITWPKLIRCELTVWIYPCEALNLNSAFNPLQIFKETADVKHFIIYKQKEHTSLLEPFRGKHMEVGQKYSLVRVYALASGVKKNLENVFASLIKYADAGKLFDSRCQFMYLQYTQIFSKNIFSFVFN